MVFVEFLMNQEFEKVTLEICTLTYLVPLASEFHEKLKHQSWITKKS